MKRLRLLDLFCGGGGAAMGYHQAGFEVVGVDIKLQPRFPFDFVQADALEYVSRHGQEYDVIHASPPCQGYSRLRHLPWLKGREYPMLIPATRLALQATGNPWIIENVSDAPLMGGVLCGLSLGLPLSRHRHFESSHLLLFPPCPGHEALAHGGATMGRKYRSSGGITGINIGVQSRIPGIGHNAGWRAAAEMMGIDWMIRDELAQAIPPAYTCWLGQQLRGMIVSGVEEVTWAPRWSARELGRRQWKCPART